MNSLKSILNFFQSIFENRQVLYNLTKRDFNSQYVGSALGFVWSFIQPLSFALIIWFVFTVGFKSGNMNDVPFAVYLLSGMIIWNFFSDSLLKGTNSLTEYSFLVKKVQFRVSLIPLFKIGSALLTHLIFISILIVLLLFNGYYPTLYWFQSVYYILATIILCMGLGWIFSAVNVFFKDTSQIISIILQIGVWASPVFWSYNMFPPEIRKVLAYNPLAYIIEGYRNSFIYNIPFWEQDNALIFWGFAFISILLGAYIFVKLRPHFADVL